jgi:predicted nucleic acid-binding protein
LLPAELRSLDAIHLATAQELGDDLKVLVTYDERMAAAARQLGYRIVQLR